VLSLTDAVSGCRPAPTQDLSGSARTEEDDRWPNSPTT